MLIEMNWLRRRAVRAIPGCFLALALSGAAFSQQIPCPVASDFTNSSPTGFNAKSPCVVGLGVTLFNASKLNNESGATLTVDGALTNGIMVAPFTGVIDNSGMLTNFGTLTNPVGSRIENLSGGTLTNAGTFNNVGPLLNSGTVNNASALTNNTQITNFNTLTNFVGGTLTNTSLLENENSLENDGTITNIGFGRIQNDPGAILLNNGVLTIAFNIGNPGGTPANTGMTNYGTIINSPGATLTNSDALLNDGVINIQGGGTLNNVGGGVLSGTGTINGNVSNSAATVQPGLVSPFGASPGTLTINGNYTQDPSGTLAVALSGDAPGDWSVLDVSGLATLDGTVNFDAVNGFTPNAGDNFTFLLFGSESGNFGHMELTNWTCPVGDTCKDVLGPGSLTLEITSGGPNTVPEPGSLLLIGSGLVGLAGWARRRLTI